MTFRLRITRRQTPSTRITVIYILVSLTWTFYTPSLMLPTLVSQIVILTILYDIYVSFMSLF
jgi:hypothetical protein